jgi:glutamate-1-semialdehyde 2,1-aminomutase
MNYEEIKAKTDFIVKNPIKNFKPAELKAILDRYEKNHQKSKIIYERMRKIIPGGVEHNLAFNHPFPIASKRVFDCYMETVDDITMIDYLMCGGPIILGHQYQPLIDKVVETIQSIGPCHGITHEYEYLAAEELQKHFPSCEIIRWLQTGTEADMLAIRIARAFTNRKWVIKIGGSYHGWSDHLLILVHLMTSKNSVKCLRRKERSQLLLSNQWEGKVVRLLQDLALTKKLKSCVMKIGL